MRSGKESEFTDSRKRIWEVGLVGFGFWLETVFVTNDPL